MDRTLHSPVSGGIPRRWAKSIGAAAACVLLGSGAASAQTSFGASATIVFPVVAATPTFTGNITLFNPNGFDITVNLSYFDANNLAVPGQKPCADVVVPADLSVQFTLASQCTLDSTSHFGLLVARESIGTSRFYGYSRTENNAGIGFSIEGFPVANFRGDVSVATGLKSSSAAPGFMTNCFVSSLADPVSYELALIDGSTNVQIGSTLSGSLGAYQQLRILDVFGNQEGVNAPAGDYSNVLAEFTETSGGTAALIGFCTVQDNVSFGADFRIAKRDSPPPAVVAFSAQWGGSIQTIPSGTGGYIFAGPTTAVTLTDTARLSAFGSGAFARQSGPTTKPSIAVCYQNQSGPGPVTTMGTPSDVSVSTTTVSFGQAGSAVVPAGTYDVGFCIQNNAAGSLNKNENTSGFVFVTP